MDYPQGKKLFSAERQRLQSMGAPVQVAAAGPESAEILAAIAALRNDVRSLDEAVREQHLDAANAEPDADSKLADLQLMRNEVRAMSMAIEHTKTEIAALRPINSEDDRLMVVTQELDAIVSATEEATNSILEAAEKVDMLAEQIEALDKESTSHRLASDIRDTIIVMFEACNFQDITGQRISKVVRTLKFVEERVNRMIEIWGQENFESQQHSQEELDEEAKLLNGPQLANQGVSQADIDKLFD